MWGTKVKSAFKQFRANEDGTTAIEYGLIASLISIAVFTGASLMGDETGDSLDDLATKWDAAAASQSK